MKQTALFDNRTGINTVSAKHRDFLYILHPGTSNDSAMLRVSGLSGAPVTRLAEGRPATLPTGVPRGALMDGGFPIAIAFKNRTAKDWNQELQTVSHRHSV